MQLLINSGVLQLLSDLVSSRQEQLIAASDEERRDDYVLNERIILCSSQLLQLIAIRIGSVASGYRLLGIQQIFIMLMNSLIEYSVCVLGM